MAVKGDQEISFTVEERITPEFLYKYYKLDPKKNPSANIYAQRRKKKIRVRDNKSDRVR